MNTANATLDDFRLDSPTAIEALLRQLLQDRGRVMLATPDGINVATHLWALDLDARTMSFEVAAGDPLLAALLDCPELLASAYLDRIRLEFELESPVLVKGDPQWTLRAPIPDQLFRFQRRQAFRVQPLGGAHPVAILPPRTEREGPLRVRVLDLSISGVALSVPALAPATGIGTRIEGVRIELDRDSHFETALTVRHVGAPAAGMLRLGCELGRLPTGAERELQAYIDLTQKRHRLLRRS